MAATSNLQTPGMRYVLRAARREALRLGQKAITPELYLLGILRKGDGLAIQALHYLKTDPKNLREALEATIPQSKDESPDPALQKALDYENALEEKLDDLYKRAFTEISSPEDLEAFRQAIQPEIDILKHATEGTDRLSSRYQIPVTEESEKLLQSAADVARELKSVWIGTEHLLVALSRADGTEASRILRQFGIDANSAKREVLNVLYGGSPQ